MKKISNMESISNSKLNREKGDNRSYGSFMSQPGNITSQEREAAEVLIQMGLGLSTPPRRSIITETKSATSELTLKPTGAQQQQQQSSVIVSSVSTKPTLHHGPIQVNNSISGIIRSRSEPSAFVPVHFGAGGFSMGQQVQHHHNLSGVSIHPVSSPVTPQRVPVSVVQRKDTVGRNRKILSSPPSTALNSLNHQAITIRPISMDGNNREISTKQLKPVQTAPGVIYSNRNASNSVAAVNRPIKVEKDLLGLNSMARTELDILSAEPVTSVDPSPRQIFMTSSSSSSSNGRAFNNNSNIKKLAVVEGLNNQFYNPIPINIGSDHHNVINTSRSNSSNATSVPSSWIISNITKEGRIQIVSPSQLSSSGGNVATSGGILLPGTTYVITSNNNNGSGTGSTGIKKDLNSNFSENAEQQRMRQNKAIKKTLRTKAPLSRDASEPIAVDEFKIPKEFWAKAFVQSDICHAAGILFKALFTPEEIQNCTLRGRNGTFLLDLKKRSAIFRAVGWMKNKNQNPYSFDSNNLNNIDVLTQDEKMIIEKKVFVERRYQTSRKIRDVPSTHSKRRNNKANRNEMYHHQQQQNALTVLSSEESNPPQEMIVKAEPSYVLDKDFKDGSIKNEGGQPIQIKYEQEDIEPMDIENDNPTVISETSPTSSSQVSQPTSPKQMKLMVY